MGPTCGLCSGSVYKNCVFLFTLLMCLLWLCMGPHREHLQCFFSGICRNRERWLVCIYRSMTSPWLLISMVYCRWLSLKIMTEKKKHRWPLPRRPDLSLQKTTLGQVVAWCHQTPSHYLSQCWPRSMSNIWWVRSGLCITKLYMVPCWCKHFLHAGYHRLVVFKHTYYKMLWVIT